MKEQIHKHVDEILENIGRLVAINSEQGPEKEGMPFGEGPAKALEEALKIAEKLGFETVNLDNYCGYAQMGDGEEIIGIAGHLDIVPAGEGWIHDPFEMTREGDYVYGRGTTDDKGPVIAALYAMKLLKESGIKLNKRVRLIMGCNEENGSKCMEYYNQVAETLSYGFTPDADFPCIHGEKGRMVLRAYSKHTKILSMKGGFVENAVCDQCETVLPYEYGLKEKLEEKMASSKLESYEIREENDKIHIFAKGVSAHASTPYLGVNAAGETMECLYQAGYQDDFVTFYHEHIGTSCDGAGLGLKCEDAYGALTLCQGTVGMEDGKIVCTIDIRVPVTLTEEDLRSMCSNNLENEMGEIKIIEIGSSLFYPKESPLVSALYKAYVDVTGDSISEPKVIGGGTYAKSLKNVIAFGPEKHGVDYRIHSTDEFLKVSDLEEAVQIYMTAIKNLLEI